MPKDSEPLFRLRVVSDLHVGSRWGLWPPEFVHDDEVYPQNKFNKFLWECWTDAWKNAPQADLLIVNGDLTDGRAYKDEGQGVKTPELDTQQAAVVEVLRPVVAGAREWVLIRGTPYHERWFGGIGVELNAKKWPGGGRSGRVLDLNAGGFALNVAHHPEGGATLYKGTTLDKTILWSIISSGLGKTHPSNIIIRSHWHFYGCLQANGRTIVHTPCWQLQTPFAEKLAYFRFQPDIGYVDFLLRPGEPHPTVIPTLYPTPMAPVMKI